LRNVRPAVAADDPDTGVAEPLATFGPDQARIVTLAACVLSVAALCSACGGSDEEPAASVGDITCSRTMLQVTPRVQTRHDGVHVNARVSDQRGVALTVGGHRVSGATVLQLPPGGVRVRCSHGPGSSMEAGFEVVEAN
jgi:hypothetical protein